MIILLGTISYITFPKEEMPEIDLKTVAVIIKYDGMSSNEIEKLITEPLERKLMTLKDIKEIISIAKEAKVDAVHPGYGFLSENPKFVSALKRSKIKFIGPNERALKVFGDKFLDYIQLGNALI